MLAEMTPKRRRTFARGSSICWNVKQKLLEKYRQVNIGTADGTGGDLEPLAPAPDTSSGCTN